jgi:cellulose synthase operon protein C
MRNAKRLVLVAAALAALVTGSAPAWAQTAPTTGPKLKLQNRKTKDIKLQQNERTDKLLNQAKGQKTGKKAEPELNVTADRFFQVETALQQDIDQMIETLADSQGEFDKDDERWTKIGFQLAEAYAEKVRYHHMQAMEALNKADRAANPKDKQKWLAENKAQAAKEKEFLLKSIQGYKKILDNPASAKFPQIEEVVFYYAFTLQAAGYAPQARDVYKILLTKYQGSKYVPDAYQAFADYYFEEQDFGNALAFYDKVLQFPKASIYPWAVYKKGWVFFNLRRFDDAMKQFYDTVQLAKKNKNAATLGKAARKDFVRAYSESETAKAEQALRRFQQVDNAEAYKMLAILGDYYLDQGKAPKAIYVFHQLMKDKPKDSALCDWQYKVVQATIIAGTNQQKVDELASLIKLYTHVSESKQVTGTALDECYENAAGVTAVFATNWHAEGLRTLNQDTLGLAHQLYRVYLENFDRAENVVDMQVNYSELLWTRASMEKDPRLAPSRWEETAGEHSKVVQMKGVTEEQKKSSAYATVIAIINSLAVDPNADRPDGKATDDDSKPVELTDKEKKMIQAFDVYLSYVKSAQDEERTVILFLKCRMYFKHNLFDQAVPLCGEILNKRPDHETAYYAMNIVLNSLEKAGRGEELVAWVEKLLANKKFMEDHEEARPVLARIQTNAQTMKVQALEKTGQYKDCGYASEALYNANPNAPDVSQTLYNTAVCFEKAKLIGRAIQYRQKLQELPNADKDPNAQRAQMLLGDNFTQVAMYEQAAKNYQAYAERFGGEKDAPLALQYAYAFRLGMGKDKEAMDTIDLYVKQYGKKDPKEAAAAVYSVADIYAKNRDYDKMVKHLLGYIKTWGAKGGVDLLIAAHVRVGEQLWRESCPLKSQSDNSCLTLTRARALKGKAARKAQDKQCGAASKNKIVLTERKPGIARDAQQHFNTAIKLWRKGEAVNSIGGKDEGDKAYRAGEASRWVGAAMFYLGEKKYEDFLAIEFPEKLDFDPKKPAKVKDSVKRFKKYMEQKDKRGAAAIAAYNDVFVMARDGAKANDPRAQAAPWAIAGKARTGQIAQNSSDALWTAEIPPDVRRYEDSRTAYCDAMQELADPLEKVAVDNFSFCLDVSNQLSWFNEWSQLCERELAQMKPQDFPTAGEVRGTPENAPALVDTQTIFAEIPR